MNEKIEMGDYVKHENPMINDGLRMTVSDVEGEKALCFHKEKENDGKKEWFVITDLILVEKAKGGFAVF